MRVKRILVIIGTRPDAIKMAPIIKELQREPKTDPVVVSTSQHREMLDQVLRVFSITLDCDLNIMTNGQTLVEVTQRTLVGIDRLLSQLDPQMVLVQGDTSTAFAGALASFYHKIPVGHVEAGLRSSSKYSPYPEEVNRKLIAALADLHFVPTQVEYQNLVNEGVEKEQILTTGNSGIDSLLETLRLQGKNPDRLMLPEIMSEGNRVILVTAHRRENLGSSLENICIALLELVRKYRDIEIIYPVHLNPRVRQTAFRTLNCIDRVHLVEPLTYDAFVKLMDSSYLILTDSGGIQEEAPSLGKPVIVLRDTTERIQGVNVGTAKVVGTDKDSIILETSRLLDDPEEYRRMSKSTNPYGDGAASKRIVQGILHYFGDARKPENFDESKH